MLSKVLQTVPEAALRQVPVRRDATAFIVIDMQKYFLGMVEAIVPRLKRVIGAFRKARLPVVYTQHGYNDPDRDSGMLGEWWGDPIIIGTTEWELIPEIAPLDEERVIPKNRYSAFYGTNLEMVLRSYGVSDVLIGGVMTNLCCETTARDAFVRDFRVFFLVDGTATVSEDYHLATLKNLAYGFAYLKECDDIVEQLSLDDE